MQSILRKSSFQKWTTTFENRIALNWADIRTGILLWVIFLVFLSLVQFSTPDLPDNDGYYHIKLAYLMRTEGLTPNFDWLPLSILNAREYYDHHFLFHVALIPFTFGNTMRIFGRAGLYIKNTDVIERLSHITSVVFDKTGTLTRPNENRITYSGEPLSPNESAAVFSLVRQSTHPLSNAVAAGFSGLEYFAPEHFVEVAGRGIFGKVNGVNLKIGSEEYVCGTLVTEIKSSVVFVAVNEKVKGHFTVTNQYREGFEQVLHTLKGQFKLYMISGDNDAEAQKLSAWFETGNLLFNQKPGDKAAFIQRLQQNGEIILMTGDGLNDAGALMQADVALTVADKAYHFSPASDAVLEASQFARLARFIGFTITSLNIVKLSFVISFFYNVIGVSIALTGNLSPVIAAILMPISSVSVVAFATFVTRTSGKVKL